MVSETRKSKIKVSVRSPASSGQIASSGARILAFIQSHSASAVLVTESWFLRHLFWVSLRSMSTKCCGVLGYQFRIKGSLPAHLTKLVVEAYLGKIFFFADMALKF